MTRAEAIRRLLDLEGELQGVLDALRAYPWDAPSDIGQLEARHLASVLARYRGDLLSASMVETWANAVEGREDVEIAAPFVGEVLHELANPSLTEPLTVARAAVLVAEIGDLAS